MSEGLFKVKENCSARGKGFRNLFVKGKKQGFVYLVNFCGRENEHLNRVSI